MNRITTKGLKTYCLQSRHLHVFSGQPFCVTDTYGSVRYALAGPPYLASKSWPKPSRAEPSCAEPGRAEPGRAEPTHFVLQLHSPTTKPLAWENPWKILGTSLENHRKIAGSALKNLGKIVGNLGNSGPMFFLRVSQHAQGEGGQVGCWAILGTSWENQVRILNMDARRTAWLAKSFEN